MRIGILLLFFIGLIIGTVSMVFLNWTNETRYATSDQLGLPKDIKAGKLNTVGFDQTRGYYCDPETACCKN